MYSVNDSDFKQPLGPTIHTCHWSRQCALNLMPRPENIVPAFDTAKIEPMLTDYHVWDSWFVLTEDGQVANIGGMSVFIALVKPLNDKIMQYGNKILSDRERIAYFYSQDATHYAFGGFLFNTPLYHDSREWSGSTILRMDGRLQTFYTLARGLRCDGVWQTEQRIATAIQRFDYQNNEKKQLIIHEPDYHAMLIEPDGILYETCQQASEEEKIRPSGAAIFSGNGQVNNFCFRDPKFYKDTQTGRSYLLFEANTGPRFCPGGRVLPEYIGDEDVFRHFQPTPDDLKANGCVGVLELTNQDYTFGSFLHPWLTTNLVTDEIERINILSNQGYVYLFVVAHGNKCTALTSQPDLINRDYMIGFRAKTVFGELEPLNETGLVIQQKSFGDMYQGQEENHQYLYSWLMVPTSTPGFFDCISYAAFSSNAVGDSIPIKTAGPTLTIQVDGLNTRIVNKRYTILPAH